MKNLNKEHEIWFWVLPFTVIWIVVLYVSGINLGSLLEALKKVPNAIVAHGFLYLIFKKWFWRWRIFGGWLIPFPDLQGTWEGTLSSTFVSRKTGKKLPPIAAVFVIKQTFDSVSITMNTGESSSYSQGAVFLKERGANRLRYTYTNRPDPAVRHQSEIHDGAADLRIIESPELALEGEYWTGRKTTGSIKLKLKSRDLVG